MDEEYKVCWKNFQDNIASGFQNLYDRGDLVDVTLAVDGKLLQAHKTVLAICSPYFQEIFITNPCQHPIIILKDVSFNIMCEILEFMYQGVVNVKYAELPAFMKIGQLLQIKGLAKNMSTSAASTISEKSPQIQNAEETTNTETAAGGSGNGKSNTDDANVESSAAVNTLSNKTSNTTNVTGSKQTYSPSSSPAASPVAFNAANQTPQQQQQQQHYSKSISTDNNSSSLHQTYAGSSTSLKRPTDYSTDSLAIFSRKQYKRSALQSMDNSNEHNNDAESSMDPNNTDDFYFPHISMVEGRFDAGNMKRDAEHHALPTPSPSLRNSFSMDYNLFKNSPTSSVGTAEYPNDLHMPNDYSKNYGNHMEVPPIAPGEHWFQGKLEFMLSQRGKPLLVHDGHTFGIQYVRKDKKYWQCNLSRKYNCKARVTTTDLGEIIVTNNEHCHTEIRQHLRKDYQRQKVMMNALINLSSNRFAENLRRQNSAHQQQFNSLSNFQSIIATHASQAAEMQQQTSQSLEAAGLLDLAKLAAAGGAVGGNSDKMHLPLHQTTAAEHDEADDDDAEPIDCGIRSMLSNELLRKSNNSGGGESKQRSNSSSSNQTPDNFDDWKRKTEQTEHE